MEILHVEKPDDQWRITRTFLNMLENEIDEKNEDKAFTRFMNLEIGE